MVPIYYGVFVPNCGGKLDKVVIFQHVTYGFKTEYPMEMHGKPVDIQVVGYGNDGQNEAYLVKLPKWTKEFYRGSDVKHLTLSVSYGAKPVDSYKLNFTPIEKPFILEGIFGYFDGEIHVE